MPGIGEVNAVNTSRIPPEFWTMPQSRPPYVTDVMGGFLRSLNFSVLGPHEFYYFGTPEMNGAYAMQIPVPAEMMTPDTENLEWMVVYPNQRVVYHTGLTLDELADYLTENEAWLPGERFVVYRKPICNDEVPEHVATIGLHDKPYAIMRCGE